SHGLAGRGIRGFRQDNRKIEIHRFTLPPSRIIYANIFFKIGIHRPPSAARSERSGRLRHPLPVHLSVRAQPATGTGGLPDLPGPSPPGASACPASAARLSNRRPLPPGASTCPST